MTLENGPCTCTDPTKIHELWAYIAEDPQGEEGIIAMPTGMGVMPLVGADRERMQSLRRFAVIAGQERGKPVRLVRFHMVEEWPLA